MSLPSQLRFVRCNTPQRCSFDHRNGEPSNLRRPLIAIHAHVTPFRPKPCRTGLSLMGLEMEGVFRPGCTFFFYEKPRHVGEGLA